MTQSKDDLQQLLDGVLSDFETVDVNKPEKKTLDELIDESTPDIEDPMLQELESMFADENFASGLEDIMKQLLNRETLYEPLQALKEQYEQLNDPKYREQLSLVNQMLNAYDNEEDHRIPELIEQLQQHEMPEEFGIADEGCPVQ